MADVKITALAVLTAADPINDAIPIVDVSDISMAASGTTKRISVNNILGASGTATLASATITGDLTVDTSTLKVDSTNNRVGIATATPATALQVVGEIRSSADISNSSDTIIYSFSGGTAGSVRAGLQLIGSTPEIRVYLSSATALTINSTSNLVLKGGTAAANGVGVTFPATQVASSDANCLDDYEEGTWTIGLKFGGASVGLTTSADTGRYTKVGRQVSISGTVQLSNKGSSTGSATITGLPFGVGTNNEAYAAANLRLSGISYTGAFQAFVANATPVIYIEQISILGAVTDLTDSNYTNSSSMMFNLTYTV